MTQETKGRALFVMYVAPGTNTRHGAYIGQEEVQLFDSTGKHFRTIHGPHTSEQINKAFEDKGITSWTKSNKTVEKMIYPM